MTATLLDHFANISTDGLPLTVQVSDFVWSFPFGRVKRLHWFLQPEYVVAWVSFYLFFSKPLLRNFDLAKSRNFQKFVALHNICLAIFSWIVALYSWKAVIQLVHQKGLEDTYCNAGQTMWTNFGPWAVIFYLSKYYELVDTWILILKGKEPSFLQLYHHVGIVVTLWGGVASQAGWTMIVVLLNSVIHTIMYSYFFVKTLWPEIQIPAAHYLTGAQIGQFFLGIVLQCHMPQECDSPATHAMCIFIIGYAIGLIGLFVKFANKKYKPRKKRV